MDGLFTGQSVTVLHAEQRTYNTAGVSRTILTSGDPHFGHEPSARLSWPSDGGWAMDELVENTRTPGGR